MVDERTSQGEGIYVNTITFEGGKRHFRTDCYGMDTVLFREWPNVIDTRQECTDYEMQAMWFHEAKGTKIKEVHWQETGNGFRQGDQKDLLLWDRHSDMYAQATEDQKAVLAALSQETPIQSLPLTIK